MLESPHAGKAAPGSLSSEVSLVLTSHVGCPGDWGTGPDNWGEVWGGAPQWLEDGCSS